MRILIQKFGGTSVADKPARACVVEKIKRAQAAGFSPVAVVSAIGRRGAPYATDTLLALGDGADKRDLDQLMGCGEIISAVVMTAELCLAGVPAAALTGAQAGIVTDADYGQARIQYIDGRRIRELLAKQVVPVVCGFQGVSPEGDLTTLGRGGSDTTAAALGAALAAEKVEIYTDVAGVMTADPRLVPCARVLKKLGYQEVCQLAQQGAGVIHPRAVEIAMKKRVPLVVRSTFSDEPGTLITDDELDSDVQESMIAGVTYSLAVCRLVVDDVDANRTVDVFRLLSEAGVSVDLINVYPHRLLFTVSEQLAQKAQEQLTICGFYVQTEPDCAKVSVVGGGMCGVPGVMARIAAVMAAEHIDILQTADSHSCISILIKKSQTAAAVAALHEAFDLGK